MKHWPYGVLSGGLLLLSAFYIVFGEIDPDEGFYVYSAWLTSQGYRVYTDFFFTQMPLVPWVYGVAFAIFGNSMYLARVMTACFGLAAIGLVTATAVKWKGHWAGVCCLTVVLLHPIVIRNFCIVKTYAMATFLAAFAVFCLAFVQKRHLSYFACGLFLIFATCARLSFAIAIPLFVIYVLLEEKRLSRVAAIVLLLHTIIGLSVLAALAFPEPRAFLFDVLGFHVQEDRDFAKVLAGKALMLGRICRDFGPMLGLFGASILFAMWQYGHGLNRPTRRELFVAVLAVLLLAVHVIPKTDVSEYVVVALPLVALFCSCMVADALLLAPAVPPGLASLLLATVLCVPAMARSLDWYDWTFSSPPHLRKLGMLAEIIGRHAQPGARVLTECSEVAFVSGTVLPVELVMNCGYIPQLTDKEAAGFHCYNLAIAQRIYDTFPADVVVLEEGQEEIHPAPPRSLKYEKIRKSGFVAVGTVPDYSFHHSRMTVFARPAQ